MGVIVAVAAVMAVLATLVVIVLRDGDDETRVAAAGEVFLEPATATGRDPFTPSVDTNSAPPPVLIEPVVTVATTAPTTTVAVTTTALGSSTVTPSSTTTSTVPVTTTLAPAPGGVRTVDAAAPGLYGGTRNDAACDPEAMIDYLTATPEKAVAWAGVQGIAAADIPTYIRSLTPVVLRADTRVTNHGYRDGLATSNQSILQAGTAVLVDDYGIPRARCSCGNPLTPPIAQTTGTTYVGDPWPGFQPTSVVVVVNVTNVQIDNFVVVDLNGGYFGRTPPKLVPAGMPTDGEIYVDSLCDLFPTAAECLPPTTTTTAAPTTVATTLPEPTLGTGDIQFTLRWSSTADLDLAVLDPNGEEINFASRTSSSGGQLDVDSNANCAEAVTNPVENVFWPTGQSIDGVYSVAVSYYAECGAATGPQSFQLTALIDGVAVQLTPQSLRQTTDGSLSAPGDRKIFTVDKTAGPPISATTAPPTTVATTTATTAAPAPGGSTAPTTPATSAAPVGTPPTTASPGDTVDLATYCAAMYPPPEIGPENPWYTLCMHDPTVS